MGQSEGLGEPAKASPPPSVKGKDVFDVRRQELKDAARRRKRNRTIFAGERQDGLAGEAQIQSGRTLLG